VRPEAREAGLAKPSEVWALEEANRGERALGARRINAPKSNKSRRVDMSEQLGRVLQGLVARHEADARHKGQACSPWLFPGRDGEPITPGAFWQNVWRPLLRRSGLPYRKPHTLRHSYASFLIQNRENLAYIRDQLGHHSIKLTVDTYGHLVPGDNRGAVNKLDDATGRNLYATSNPVRGDQDEPGQGTSSRKAGASLLPTRLKLLRQDERVAFVMGSGLRGLRRRGSAGAAG
jgi:integrase